MTTSQLLIRVADSIAGLAAAPDHVILEVGTAAIAGCFWAPELHLIGGRLYCFFAPCVGATDWTLVRCHIMRLRDDGDPVLAADWEPPRPVLQADGSPLRRDPDHPGLSLDLTYVEDGGRGYVIWSQRYITDRVGDAELWIATIDPADPWRLTCEPVRIVTAEYGWDHEVAEGAFATRHGDRLVVTYSGSAVGPTSDGHLVLDQRPDEEVAPHLRRVRAIVRVAAAG